LPTRLGQIANLSHVVAVLNPTYTLSLRKQSPRGTGKIASAKTASQRHLFFF
jgi:hypothetical protein